MTWVIQVSDLQLGMENPQLSTKLLSILETLSRDLIIIPGDAAPRAPLHQV